MRKICIGLHVYEQPERLFASIRSLRANTNSRAEVVLLPDGPDAATRNALSTLTDFAQLPTSEVRGAAACFNRLAAYSNAGVVVLLESGAQVGPRWLEHLVRALDADSRNGLAGPSTNISWNEQCVFPRAGASEADVARTVREAEAKFGDELRGLEPLHSLAEFCYAVRRQVIECIGAADDTRTHHDDIRSRVERFVRCVAPTS